MIKKLLVTLLMSMSAAAAMAVPFGSQSVLVIEDDTGKVLLEKNANQVVSIASLTKLMTAMVVLDAKQNMHELIAIDQRDVDIVKHSSSRVPVGGVISRQDVLALALMSSDNRAAAALGRTFPGGVVAFKSAVRAKVAALGMSQTVIEEPTGLSPNNKSTAQDLVKMARAASTYPEITRITTESSDTINISGRDVEYRNTNRLVGAKGWEIGLSKTGYTEEAGRCLIMKIKSAGKNATLVLLNAKASSARIVDALSIRRFIAGDEAPAPALARAPARRAAPVIVLASAPRAPALKTSLRSHGRHQPRVVAAARAPVVKAGLHNRVKLKQNKPVIHVHRRA
jgi:D-alanyl-D-alanine endopeptidase (penicillin-binding protein 7)